MVKPAFKIIWDRKALDHFKETLAYLQTQSDQTPKIVKEAIFTRLDRIKTNSLIFEPDKLKSSLNKDFRAFVIFSYRVTYQINSDAKEIRVYE